MFESESRGSTSSSSGANKKILDGSFAENSVTRSSSTACPQVEVFKCNN